jgi:hypothetical protein
MKVTPIIFSAPMICALREGRKTMTRRVIKPQPPDYIQGAELWLNGKWMWCGGYGEIHEESTFRCRYGAPGDLLYVKEGFSPYADQMTRDYCRYADSALEIQPRACVYRADHPDNMNLDCGGDGKWHSPIHMPRRYSRLTLELTDVRAQRVQEISEADCIAEGIIRLPASGRFARAHGGQYFGNVWFTAQKAFREGWDSLHGPAAWDANKFVWALTFAVHQVNVDVLLKQREGAAV